MVRKAMTKHISRCRLATALAAASMLSIICVYYTKAVSHPGNAKPKSPMTMHFQVYSGRTENALLSTEGSVTALSHLYTTPVFKPKHNQGPQTNEKNKHETDTRERASSNFRESFQGGASGPESTTDGGNDENAFIEDANTATTTEEMNVISNAIPVDHSHGTEQKGTVHKNDISSTNTDKASDRRRFATLIERRLAHIEEKCRVGNVDRGKSKKTIRKGIIVQHLFNTCVAPKGGSTSWYDLKEKLKELHLANEKQTYILSVRHPLSRLTSAYRDKFLNGAPISAYDDAWRNATGSSQTWRQRWSAYWLPALISRGEVHPSEYIHRKQAILGNISNVCKRTLRSNAALTHQVERDFRLKMQHLISLHSNATFSFRDFLQHVLWTREAGMMDHHWAPQTCLCDPCGQRYDYVLHLETIGQEVRHVLDDLGVPEGVHIGSDHNTKKVLNASDADYFEGIGQSLMKKIYSLYRDDFELFGYTTEMS